MSRKRDTRSPASVLGRLRNAGAAGQSVKNVQVLFVLERVLARVARSSYRDRLILKGGVLLYLMLGQWVRPTEDLDILARGIPGASLDAVLAEVLAVDAGDGLAFDSAAMTAEDIRENTGYLCRRFHVPYRFGGKHVHFIKLDLSFGDPVLPGPRLIEVRPILQDFETSEVLGYPLETFLAEKIETLLARGAANTRSKDLFDLWTLSRTVQGLSLEPAGAALSATAHHRGTPLRMDALPLQPGFAQEPRQAELWKSFGTTKGLDLPGFRDVMEAVQGFIAPIVGRAMGEGREGTWDLSISQWS